MTLNLTQAFMLAAVAVIAAFDVIVIAAWGEQASISHNLLRASREWPIIPLVLGILIGHVFWPIK